MPAENVRSIGQNVNPSVDDICRFLDAKASCGDIAESSARLAGSAIRVLSTCIAPDEPQGDVAYMRENLEKLGNRWSTLNPDSKGDTARSYVSRVKTALNMFFAWRDDPSMSFRRRVRAKKVDAAPGAEPAAVKEASVASAQAPKETHTHKFRVAPDKYLTFDLPESGLTVAEWKKWVAHTLTLCDDFNPDAAPPTVGSTGVVRG
jgi:hypothetical protein